MVWAIKENGNSAAAVQPKRRLMYLDSLEQHLSLASALELNTR